MTIQVKKNLVSSSKYPIKAPYAMKAQYITVHNTANDASAAGEVNYMVNNNQQVSFHYAVDPNEVVQGVPTNRNAWHAGDSKYGDGNRKSIGIEICYSESGGTRYKQSEALAIKFIAQLLKERNWGVDRVRTHKSWTEIGVKKGYSSYVKNCPHQILDDGRWGSFIAAIQKELNLLNKPDVVQVSNPNTSTSSVYTVVKGDTLSHIALRFNTTVAKLKSMNGLKSDLLQIGQKLQVAAVHTVVKGDTLWDLSRKYGMSVADLKKANGLKSDLLEIGQKLKIEEGTAPKPAPKPVAKPKPVYYTVKYGDTLSEIAVKYKTTSSKIAKLNASVKNIHRIYVGQRIRVS